MNEKAYYLSLFNSVTDAIKELELVRLRLALAQCIAEELYLQEQQEE